MMDKLLQAIFGQGFDFSQQGLTGVLGNEGFANLLKGGTSLYSAMQMGDMLDFQKGLATKADTRTQELFDRDKREQEALNSLQFA